LEWFIILSSSSFKFVPEGKILGRLHKNPVVSFYWLLTHNGLGLFLLNWRYRNSIYSPQLCAISRFLCFEMFDWSHIRSVAQLLLGLRQANGWLFNVRGIVHVLLGTTCTTEFRRFHGTREKLFKCTFVGFLIVNFRRALWFHHYFTGSLVLVGPY
jgi:hypothetical protein